MITVWTTEDAADKAEKVVTASKTLADAEVISDLLLMILGFGLGFVSLDLVWVWV